MIEIERINEMTKNLEEYISINQPDQEIDMHLRSLRKFSSHYEELIHSTQYKWDEAFLKNFNLRIHKYKILIEALEKMKLNQKDLILNMRAYNAAKDLFEAVLAELEDEFKNSSIERQNQLVQDFILPHNIVFRYFDRETPLRSDLIR